MNREPDLTAQLTVFETPVQPDWVDYNGHMRDAYFGLAFSFAIDALMDRIGLDAAHRAAAGGTLYVVESHQYYLQEAHGGDPLRVQAQVLDADRKRLHLLLVMRNGATGDQLAVQECLLLHIDQSGAPKVAPFPEAVQARVETLRESHAQLEPPERRSRAIAIKRR